MHRSHFKEIFDRRRTAFSVPERRRDFLTPVAFTPTMSLYEFAKFLGLQYRGTHDHAASMLGDGTTSPVNSSRKGSPDLIVAA